jgi:hypothetical protein
MAQPFGKANLRFAARRMLRGLTFNALVVRSWEAAAWPFDLSTNLRKVCAGIYLRRRPSAAVERPSAQQPRPKANRLRKGTAGASSNLPGAGVSARSLRHPLTSPRRKAHPEISVHQSAHGRIAVRKFFAQPAVDRLDASRSRGVSHAFAKDCTIIRVGQVQARRETIEPFPGVGAEGLHGLWSSSPSRARPHPAARPNPVLLDQLLIRTLRRRTSPSHPRGFRPALHRQPQRQSPNAMTLCSPQSSLLAAKTDDEKGASVGVWRPRPRSVRQLLVG